MIRRHDFPVKGNPGQSPLPPSRSTSRTPTHSEHARRRLDRLISAETNRLHFQIDEASDGHVILQQPARSLPQSLQFDLDVSPIIVTLWQVGITQQLVSGLRRYAAELARIADQIEADVGNEFTDELRPHCFLAVTPDGEIVTQEFLFSVASQIGQEWADSNNRGPVKIVQCELSDFPEVERRFRDWLENGRDVTPCHLVNQSANRGAKC